MIPYLLHASILLSGSFIFYWLFIRKETFFKLNRWVLVSGILLSVLIPLIQIPENWSIRKIDHQEIVSKPISEVGGTTFSNIENTPVVSEIKDAFENENVNSGESTKPIILKEKVAEKKTQKSFFEYLSSFSTILWYIYLAGVIIFFLAFLIQLIILLTKMYSYVSYQDGRYRIVELVKDEAPYSFWNSIFINPTKYDFETYTQIIDHEKIHIRQVHFFDKILSELLLIAFWFNPFVWFYRNAIINNLEYLTDSSMLKEGVEKQTYQLSLLKVSVPQHPLNLSTNYNNSFLKNRIAMMNSKKSSARSSWKYMFLFPLIGFSMISMNETQSRDIDFLTSNDQTILIDKDTVPEKISTTATSTARTITSDSPNENEGNISTSIVSITPKLNIKSNDKTTRITSTQNSIIKDKNEMVMNDLKNSNWNTNLKPGHWAGEIDGNRVCFQLNNSRPAKGWTSISTECFDRSELSDLPMEEDKNFLIKRAAGTLKLIGSFDKEFGDGTFKFESDPGFLSYLKSEGMDISEEHDQYHLFLNDINKDYVSTLKSLGFKPKGRDLVDLSIHGIDKEELNGFVGIFKKLDYKAYEVNDLVQLKIHNVNPDYVNEIIAQGMTDLNVQQLIQAKIHNVKPSFIKAIKDYGMKNLKMNQIVQMSIHNVDVDYLTEMQSLGFRDLSNQEITQAKIHNVDPDFIRGLKEQGYGNMDMQEIIQFAIHNIDIRDIKAFKAEGFEMSTQGIIQAGIHNVSPNYIEKMRKLGFTETNIQAFINAKIHGVTPSFIKRARENGHNFKTVREYVRLKIGF